MICASIWSFTRITLLYTLFLSIFLYTHLPSTFSWNVSQCSRLQ